MTEGTAENPRTTPAYRVLKAVVIILGLLIVLTLGALVLGAIMKLGAPRHEAPLPAGLAAEFPAGARIISVQVSGNRAVVALRTADGDEVDIFDTDTGRFVARIRTAEKR